MKGSSSCGLVASVFAASTAALSTSAGDASLTPCCCQGMMHSEKKHRRSAEENSSPVRVVDAKDKFAPRFDGLRFIETLITGSQRTAEFTILHN